MPSRSDVYYFGAGPAALPQAVLERASASVLNHENSGVGLIEQSHRSASSTQIVASACQHLETLLGVPNDGSYTTLWMQGGGTTQFSAVAYNLLGYWVQKTLDANNGDLEAVKAALANAKADYLVTGSWSKKAAEEAQRLLGDELVNVATNSKAATKKFGSIAPEETWNLTPKENNIFSYFCDNETVDGVEFPAFPTSLEGTLVAADMSSNILSRRVDVSKYAIIFAGAQKNVGGAGVTLVVIRSDILKTQPTVDTLRKLGLPIPPIMCHYPTLTGASSLYNTLPIFEVFICREVMAGIIARGGLEVQEKIANEKAEELYNALDQGGIYNVVPEKNVRSRMNICFRIEGGEDVEKAFLKGAEERGLTGLKGHRSVGGLRISNYNSIPQEAAAKLAGWIREFAASRK
ncbi:pyridoxal phosphate-dependent transferase [Pyronema omphalodes]|nr:pyridoxal phosphate-dependent transferase [Pyronema omphalodes]